MTQREADLLAFLDGVKRMCPISLPSLIRDRGRLFAGAALPADVRRGAKGECFMNAFLLAHRRNDLIYVEGYAHFYFPTLHAWCVTREGVVIDPTWDNPEDCAYYGIPLKREFATKATLRNKVYGVLSDMPTAHRIYKTKPERYLAAVC